MKRVRLKNTSINQVINACFFMFSNTFVRLTNKDGGVLFNRNILNILFWRLVYEIG